MKNPDLQKTQSDTVLRAALVAYSETQDDLQKARARVETIREVIKKVSDSAAAAFNGVPKTEVLRKSYDDISAALALGQITHAEAANSRKELDAQRSLIVTAEIGATESKSAQSGLESRLKESLQEINALEIKERELFGAVLVADAEAAGERYVAAAQALVEMYLRLNYLRELLRYSNHDYGRNIINGRFRDLFIPALRLQAFEGKVHKNRPDIFCDQLFLEYSGKSAESIETERQRLCALGVVMPDPSMSMKEWFERPQRETDEAGLESVAAE